MKCAKKWGKKVDSEQYPMAFFSHIFQTTIDIDFSDWILLTCYPFCLCFLFIVRKTNLFKEYCVFCTQKWGRIAYYFAFQNSNRFIYNKNLQISLKLTLFRKVTKNAKRLNFWPMNLYLLLLFLPFFTIF